MNYKKVTYDKFLKYIFSGKESLDSIINKRIDVLTKESKELNDTKFIGINSPLNINKSLHRYDLSYLWSGFIPNDVKIIFGSDFDKGNIYNAGCYYFIDDNSYIKDFFIYFMENKIEIENEFDLIYQINEFLKAYCSSILNIYSSNREDLFRPIIDRDRNYIKSSERSNSIFYKSNVAMCTEFSTMANNLLNFLGIDSNVVLGVIKLDNTYSWHAFNIVEIDKPYLVDLAVPIDEFSFKNVRVDEEPFMEEVSEEELYKYLYESGTLEFNDYFLQDYDNVSIYFYNHCIRKYISIFKSHFLAKCDDNDKKILLRKKIYERKKL